MITVGKRYKLLVFSIFTSLLLATFVMPQEAIAAKWYVDNNLGELKPEQKVVPANPKPVQLLFEFQRDGAPNPKATKQVKPWAVDALKATGAFSEIVDTPTTDGALLSIEFNNVVKKDEIDKAKRQGFSAGLSFGLLGGVVATDYYVVTLTYVPATGVDPITTTVNHALHMKYGNKDVEITGTLAKNVTEAVQTVVRQALAHGVNTIASQAAFSR